MLSAILSEIPNEGAVLEMLQRFERLLRKCARLLNYEDAYEDLVVFFLELLLNGHTKELIGKNDAVITSYISKAVKNEYIRLSKLEKTKCKLYSELSEKELFIVDSHLAYYQSEPPNWIIESKGLTRCEKEVLTLLFEREMSIDEIAKLKGKTRQAVNQTKLRALAKLRHNFD